MRTVTQTRYPKKKKNEEENIKLTTFPAIIVLFARRSLVFIRSVDLFRGISHRRPTTLRVFYPLPREQQTVERSKC